VVPIRPLGKVVAVSKDSFATITSIRALRDGRVLVNDAPSRRLILLDAALAAAVIIADTTSGTARAYGRAASALFSFYGDSSLFADVSSLSMLVVDPGGKLGRTMSAPGGPAGGLTYLNIASYGVAFDGAGAFVSTRPGTPATPQLTPGAPPITLLDGDSTLIVRANLVTRKVDTVARVRAMAAARIGPSDTPGCVSVTNLTNPLPMADAWTVMGDGTVAVVREYDYHIDWYAVDGTRVSTPKIAHTWTPLSDDKKVAFMDSLRRADSVSAAQLQAARAAALAAGSAPGRVGGAIVAGRAGGGGRAGVAGGAAVAVLGTDAIATTSSVAAGGRAGRGGGAAPCRLVVGRGSLDAASLPDYFPPFLGGQPGVVKADADGNVWIRSTEPAGALDGPVYDVVNRQGKLIDRVRVRPNFTIVGFGPGAVYVTMRDGGRLVLERAMIR
jgi:hypothetical protein